MSVKIVLDCPNDPDFYTDNYVNGSIISSDLITLSQCPWPLPGPILLSREG